MSKVLFSYSEFLIKATAVSGNEDLGNAEVSGEVLCVKIDPKQEVRFVC